MLLLLAMHMRKFYTFFNKVYYWLLIPSLFFQDSRFHHFSWCSGAPTWYSLTQHYPFRISSCPGHLSSLHCILPNTKSKYLASSTLRHMIYQINVLLLLREIGLHARDISFSVIDKSKTVLYSLCTSARFNMWVYQRVMITEVSC